MKKNRFTALLNSMENEIEHLDSQDKDKIDSIIERLQSIKNKVKIPEMLDNPNFNSLKTECAALIYNIATEGHYDGAIADAIIDEAIEAFYGPDILEWVDDNTG